MMRPLLPSLLAALLLVSAPAHADEAADLFRQGVQALDEGRVEEACTKLERSQALEAAAGTVLNLAGCYERAGRRARALDTFREALVAARARHRKDWVDVAERHIRELEALLPSLAIVRGENPADLEISLDGARWTETAPRRVDPGMHVIEARASGRRPVHVELDVRADQRFVVPPLARTTDAAAPEPSPAPIQTAAGVHPARPLGFVLGGVGVASLALTAVATVLASGALTDAKDACASYPDRCSPGAAEANDRAKTWSAVGTVSAVAGVALVAAGVVLVVLPGRRNVSASAGPGFVGLRGHF